MSEITESLYKPFVINYRHLHRQDGVNMLLGKVENVVFVSKCDKPQKEISKNCIVSKDCIIQLVFKSRNSSTNPLTLCKALKTVRHSDLQLETNGRKR